MAAAVVERCVGGDVLEAVGDILEPDRAGGGGRRRSRNLPGGGLLDLHEGVGRDLLVPTEASRGPADGDIDGRRGACRKGALGLVATEVASPRDHVLGLFLRERRGGGGDGDGDPGSDRPGIAAAAAETDADPGGDGLVPVDPGAFEEIVHHDVEIPVVVQVRERGALGDADRGESPFRGPVEEDRDHRAGGGTGGRQGLPDPLRGLVVEEGIGRGEPRQLAVQSQDVGRRQGPSPGLRRSHPLRGIAVLVVPQLAVGHQDVLEPVEIDIEEDRSPGPVAGLDPAEDAGLGEGGVPAIPLEGVAEELDAILELARTPELRGQPRHLAGPDGAFAGEHVDREEIHEAIAVEIPEIHPHREGAVVAQGESRDGLEPWFAGGRSVQPQAIRRMQVVAHVQVHPSIPVEIPELHRQPPVPLRALERLAVLVDEDALGPRHRAETSSPVVQPQHVGLAELDHLAARTHLEAVCQVGSRRGATIHRDHHGTSADVAQGELHARLVHDGVGTEVADIEVEVSIAIHIGQRQRGCPGPTPESGLVGPLLESPFPIVRPETRPASESVHQEVEIPVAIDVGEGRPGGIGPGARPRIDREGVPGGVLEPPSAPIPIEPW